MHKKHENLLFLQSGCAVILHGLTKFGTAKELRNNTRMVSGICKAHTTYPNMDKAQCSQFEEVFVSHLNYGGPRKVECPVPNDIKL